MVRSVKIETQTAKFLLAKAQMNAPNVTTHIIDSMAGVILYVQKDLKIKVHLQTISAQHDTQVVKPAQVLLMILVQRVQMGIINSQLLLFVQIHVPQGM